jgi:hypothetical protein
MWLQVLCAEISGTYETVMGVLLYESWRDSPYCIVVPSGPGKDIEGRDENLLGALACSFTFPKHARADSGSVTCNAANSAARSETAPQALGKCR